MNAAKQNQQPEQMYTITETAKVLGVSEKSVWNFVYSRRLGSVLIGRMRRIPISAIQELVERGTVTAVQ